MSKRGTIVIVILLVVGLSLLRLISESQFHRTVEPSPGVSRDQGGASRSPEAQNASLGTKTREREKKKALEVDEMYAALNAPLPGLTKFPEQTLQERILLTNLSLKKAGNCVRFGVDEKMHPSEILLERTLPAFSQENATPNDIIRHAQRTLKQHYWLNLEEGKVLFQEGSGG